MDFNAKDFISTMVHGINFQSEFGGIALFFDLCFTADTASRINFQATPRRCNRMGNLIRYPVMKTVKTAAAIYGLPPTYIRTLCRTGKIRYVVAGHRWLVNMNSLAQYFERGDPVPAEQGEAVGGIRRVAR
jgi:hypothetical protein